MELSQSSQSALAGNVGTTALANSASADERPDPAASMRPTHPHGNRQLVPCRFYATKKGCRSGDACPFLHAAASSPGDQVTVSSETRATTAATTATTTNHVPAASRQSRTVAKPISKAQRDSPRDFQIGQLTRRFRPNKEREDNESGTTLSFGLAPTDPDFPFDLNELQCVLTVPNDWPSASPRSNRPKLSVTNPDMPRGFQINVEKGFDGLVDAALKEKRQFTLLNLMNSLDRHLESFLTAEKAPTIKIVANQGSSPTVSPSGSSVLASNIPASSAAKKSKQQTVPIFRPAAVQKITPVRYYSPEERAQAEKTRGSETRQLEARLSRLPLYQKSSDGISYTVPVTPGKQEQLPISLRSTKTVKFVVPTLYPLEASSVKFQALHDKESRAVEAGFQKWVQQGPHVTLMSQVNYLAHNMHVLVNTPVPDDIEEDGAKVDEYEYDYESAIVPEPSFGETQLKQDAEAGAVDPERPHVKVIPRPPEWSTPNTGPRTDTDSDEFTTESSEYEEDDDDDEEEEGGALIPESATTNNNNPPARGIALNFPGLELYGIEILEATMLSVTVKCERCKEHTDIKNIKPANDPSAVSPVRVESCRKCANSFNIAFRPELMHPTSQRAGYLDLQGCTVFDLLPSNFKPTCAECSTAFPAPGLVAVRGTGALATCRECHRKMNFKIPEVKFMIVGPSGLSRHRLAAPRLKKENLGIVAGQELPQRGRCAHYRKSHRWFRFSCCSKVFPCDRCHDAATDHPNEHANRMICGFCSREQIYRPEDCAFCRNVVVGKAGSGFWEGGKGTRDKVKMSRKDPRKYKRR
ncbi:putative protein C18H10,09 [Talaromyces islandicus]|uniref:CHY-type domain-containing protein n=1 Tax=Talaromyces islandicus TaxID=28573 RepID=A0A0U1LLY3_TALIS|nr:putative protein C18H10,09 [Talaromyces islandicus]